MVPMESEIVSIRVSISSGEAIVLLSQRLKMLPSSDHFEGSYFKF
jgi:hypothetical protein